ncbi:conserved Plasmodium protein, unknown function [Plasmodium vinckei lentum]|uniref:Ubiquinol-cytochrome c chaperone domain-containing protein n=1 Tax=Plasmodium vinckei lentum TaxID=138297 RepID=A0A6V7S3G1_PLAVN|nr:conserved Plasmodium protein, unknown function [Plasmodium vinckei lentum]
MNKLFILTCRKNKCFEHPKRFKCLINNALNDKNLKWKTTNESYCEYILTPEEEQKLKKTHLIIASNKDIHIDRYMIYEYIKHYKENDKVSKYYKDYSCDLDTLKSDSSLIGYYYVKFLNNAIQKIKATPIINKIYNNIYNNIILKYTTNIHVFISPIYERINNESLFSKFNINKNSVREIMYFLCIHVWIYCAKLNLINNNNLKILLWEKIWDYYRALLIKYKISEFNFNTYLINMQEYSLGFCIGLDDCIGKEYYAGKIYNLLFNHIYDENEKEKMSKELMNLTIYCIRMYNFIYNLPEENFIQAKFTWPDLK